MEGLLRERGALGSSHIGVSHIRQLDSLRQLRVGRNQLARLAREQPVAVQAREFLNSIDMTDMPDMSV